MKINLSPYELMKKLQTIAYHASCFIYQETSDMEDNDPSNATLMPVYGDVYQLCMIDTDGEHIFDIKIPNGIIDDLLEQQNPAVHFDDFIKWFLDQKEQKEKKQLSSSINSALATLISSKVDESTIAVLLKIKDPKVRLKEIQKII